jgi:predicted enzyme related to lactoylglutathione lyase
MSAGIKTIVYPVTDLERAKAMYGLLTGVDPIAETAYYVGYDVDGQDIGLDPNGYAKGIVGAMCYWHVADIAASVQALADAGGKVIQEITDVGGGKLIATVEDLDGNAIGLLQP